MTDSTRRLRDAIESFIVRRGLSPTRFGRAAVGDPSFVLELRRGRSPRVDTADRALAFMGEAPLGPAFRLEVKAFLAVTGAKVSVFGMEAAGDTAFVTRLRDGLSPRLATVDRVRDWMKRNASADELRTIDAVVARDGSSETTLLKGPNGMDDSSLLYMSTREVAAFLGLSPRTLDRYRVTGDGPPFHKLGNRIRYARADVEAWVAARRRLSTSDPGDTAREAAR